MGDGDSVKSEDVTLTRLGVTVEDIQIQEARTGRL
jgi:hypothetical protein